VVADKDIADSRHALASRPEMNLWTEIRSRTAISNKCRRNKLPVRRFDLCLDRVGAGIATADEEERG